MLHAHAADRIPLKNSKGLKITTLTPK